MGVVDDAVVDDDESAYERDVLPFIRPFTAALVDSLPPGPFDAVFDHGAGTGEAALAVLGCRHVGRVVALDPSPSMCGRLRATLAGHPFSAVESTLADYPDRHNCEPFDLIVSQLSMSFVPDPLAEL